MRRKLAILLASVMLTLGIACPSQADLTVTWTESSGNLNFSIDGSWSTWEVPTPTQISTDTLSFKANGVTTFEFDLSRGNLNGPGQSSQLTEISGSGSVTGPDFTFAAPLPTTGYNLIHLNTGGFLVLEANVTNSGPGSIFNINESIDLGTGYTLVEGSRAFNLAGSPGETLTMNYVTAVPEPSSLALVGLGSLAFVFKRRRRSKKAALPIAEQV